MEECKSVRKDALKDNESLFKTKSFSNFGQPLLGLLKKVFAFICYGPGVLGFLWLIGRILKR